MLFVERQSKIILYMDSVFFLSAFYSFVKKMFNKNFYLSACLSSNYNIVYSFFFIYLIFYIFNSILGLISLKIQIQYFCFGNNLGHWRTCLFGSQNSISSVTEKAAERKERIHEWIRFIARIYINRKHDTNVPVREKFAIYAIQSLFAHSSH